MKTTTIASRGLALAATAALAAVALTGCSTESSSAGTTPGATEGGTITWAYTSAPVNWDPLVIGGTAGTYLTTPIFASLFTIDENKQIEPGLASGYEYNEAGDAITITLKPDLTFQDGTPVNAEAVKFNIDRVFSQTNSALKASYANVEQAVVVDDLTVRLDLKQPDFQIPYILAEKTGELPSPTAVAADPTAFNAASPVGAGPFIVEELVPSDHITLKKWDGYWDADNIHIDTIRINFGISPDTVISALQSGVANFAVITPDLVEAAEAADLKVLSGTDRLWGSSFFSVNRNQAPFDDPAVVEAIRAAIDPDQFIQQLAFGQGEANNQPFPQGHPDFVESLVGDTVFDPEKAQEILADAGYQPGDISFEVQALNTNGFDKVAEILQSQLSQVGITTTINVVDFTTWSKGYYGKTYPASLFGWVGRDSAVQGLSDQYDSLGVLNLSSPYVSDEFSAALSTARSTPLDSPDYEKNLQAAAEIGYQTGSNISLYTYATPLALAQNISDLPKIDGFIDWTGVTIGGN
ncbi:ABC transporter substrate-binding protein [Herbiconiux moechotypicola]|uniref:ABC transporter substrate-binding protein n=1 Tax=Herbiconiux moechotypicola TaxID=637393 RepID=A0ABP5QMF6_9MICO|nr:ABC transporter substrate-binding protein [Herbiconiux moechotypicola]MCS5730353.1 ABC transporter substrate-binding protein [Herbiconiux moechotypicola]